MSKKPRIFAHFVRLITDVCLLKFGLRNKIEVYFYKPYLGQLNLWGSIVEINNKKFKMFALFELYQWYLNSMKISAAKHNFFLLNQCTHCVRQLYFGHTQGNLGRSHEHNLSQSEGGSKIILLKKIVFHITQNKFWKKNINNLALFFFNSS